MLDRRIAATGHTGDVLHDPLCSLGFSGTRFPRDDDTLVVFIGLHIIVGGFCHGENMGCDFESILATVRVEDLICVDAHWRSVSNQPASSNATQYIQSLKGLTDTRTCPI